MSHTPFKSSPSLSAHGPFATHRSLVSHDAYAARDALGPLAPPRPRSPFARRLALAFVLGLSFAVIGGITLGLAPSGDAPVLAEKATPAGTGNSASGDALVKKGSVADAAAVPVLKTSTQGN